LKLFDETGAFVSPVEGGRLRQFAVRGAGVTVVSQGLAFAVQIISTMILARLLTPSDFGVVTMVTTFSILLMSCGQVGFPDAVRQWDDLNHFLASNLFWINVGIGFLLMVAFAGMAPLLARLYGKPEIAHIVIGVSTGIFFNNVAVLPIALLTRAMRFTASCAIDCIARVASVALSVVLAYRGWGYWALVAGTVACPLGQIVGAFTVCGWVPSLPRRVPKTGSMVVYAAQVFGRFSIYYSTRNADNLLVGWQLGPTILGYYKKAYDLFILPFNLLQIYAVSVSTLSRLKSNRTEYLRYLLNGLAVLALVAMGVCGDLTIAGKDLVRLVLGPQWDRAGEIFTIFAPGIGVMMLYLTHGIIHLSLGTPSRYLRWTALECVTTILLFVIGLRWGPEGVAVAWNASFCLLFIPAFRYAGKPIQLEIKQLLGKIWQPVLASASAGVSAAMILRNLPAATGTTSALTRAITASLLFFSLYAGAIILLYGGCDPLYRLARLLREMIPFEGLSKTQLNVTERPAEAVQSPTTM